ncbi:MAG: LapA family protein [Gammaproteobacteria bacterium]|nr:LapA family protein [Gammaproteobacteria bacterium]
MKWIARLFFLAMFTLLFVFFLFNQHTTFVYYYKELGIEVPLAIALIISLIVGVMLGCTATLGKILRLKSELKRLDRELHS